MPALKGNEEKFINGFKVDKENDDVFYSDEKHVYISKRDLKPNISVTQLLGVYEWPFDTFYWSSYKTCEKLMAKEDFAMIKPTLLATKKWEDSMIEKYNLNRSEFIKTREEIQKGYDVEREKSCARGSAIHNDFEELYYSKEQHDMQKFGLGGTFTCKKGYYKLDLEKGVYPELLINWESKDGIMRISGQSDLVILDGNDLWVVDYKTNKEIKKRSFYDSNTKSNLMLKYPLNNIQQANFWVYSLQLSLYAWMLQQIRPELVVRKLQLVHVDHNDKVTTYDCDYLKSDVERMLKHYYKTLKQSMSIDRDKPIQW